MFLLYASAEGTPLERSPSVERKDTNGAPFDPWPRVHWRLGSEVLRIAPRSMVIEGTILDWESWTGMRSPE